MRIIINGTEKEVPGESMSYQELVDIADSGRSKQALHTVVYSTKRSGDTQRSGCIAPGETLRLEEGIRITALVTDGA